MLALVLLLAPHVQLVTMGDGDDVYERFGHAALRVTDGASDLVYNFGTTDFTRPHLIRDFLRGHVKFWVSVSTFARTVAAYSHEDRTIYVQDLHLSPEAQQALADRLRWQALPEHREYDYDHFSDNCTTRVRDLIDEAAGGRLHSSLGQHYPYSIRELALSGFHGMIGMQLGTDLLLGTSVDRPITKWEAAFLPRILREGIEEAGLAGAPVEIYRRRGPPVGDGTPAYGGRILMLAIATAFMIGAILSLKRARLARVLRVVWAIAGGILGAFLLGLAAYSTVPLVHRNANVLLFWPLDFGLVVLTSSLLRGYGALRLVSVWAVFALLRPPSAVFALATGGVLAALTHELAKRRPRAPG